MDVSICIVNWNTRELLRACLRSIASCTEGIDYEVIVVDNESSDGSAAMVGQQFPQVKLVAAGANLGFARGSNLAARHATGDFVLYLNPDTELVTNAVAGMWQFLQRDPASGAVGCRILNSDGSIQLTCASAFPSPRNELSSMLLLDRVFPSSRLFSARELGYWDHEDSRVVDCLSGACMMVRRELVEQLGGFDEQLFMYGEDLDLCCRLGRLQLQLYYLATEVIYHHEGAASRKKGRSFAPLFQRASNYYFLRKNFGPVRALAYRGAVSIGAGARLVVGAASLPLWVWRRSENSPRARDFMARHGDLLLWSLGLRGTPAR